MLPAMTLQLTDILTLDPAPDAPQLLPEQAVEPEATFAGFLALRLDVMTAEVGSHLPDGGNPLPIPQLPEVPADMPLDVATDDLVVAAAVPLAPAPPMDVGPVHADAPHGRRGQESARGRPRCHPASHAARGHRDGRGV